MKQQDKEKLSGLSRYVGLIVSTVIFLLLISILMGTNAYFADEVNYNRMRSIAVTSLSPNINSISRDLYQYEVAAQNHAPLIQLQEIIQNIHDKKQAVSNSLHVLTQGGTLPGPNNNTLKIKVFSEEKLARDVEDILPAWQQADTALNTFLSGAEAVVSGHELAVFDNRQIQPLLAQADKKIGILDAGIRKSTREILDNSQRIVLVGIACTLIYFIIFLLYFMRKLRRADEIILTMQQETGHIMATVREGLFLVDDQLSISQQYSQELENIIGQRDLGGKNLNDIMRKLVPAEEVETTEEFIEQLFNERVNERLIGDLNPLNRIKVNVDDFSGFYNTRYLDFNFSRVYQKDKIVRVLTSVNDVTNAVLLEERLDEDREQNDLQTEMIVAILNTDKSLLQGFVSSTGNAVIEINRCLKDPARQHSDLTGKINIIAREVHSIKGEASALKLHAFVNISTAFEDKIKTLKEKQNLSGNDFLPLAVMLEEMLKLNQAIDHLMQRIGELNPESGAVKGERLMEHYFTNFVESVAQRNGKQISFHCHGLDKQTLSDDVFATIKDIAIQLLRNAVVHGIEAPQIRQEYGKNPRGQIILSLIPHQECIELCVEDDGGGINFEKIREKLVAQGLCSSEDAAALDRKQLAAAIFRPGMSTAAEVSEDAGRGVGMDVIKDRVYGLGGKIRMSSADGQHTRFMIDLPLVKEAKNV